MEAMNYAMMKQFTALENGGRMAVLMGDIMRSVENALLIGKISFVMMLLRGQACRWGTE